MIKLVWRNFLENFNVLSKYLKNSCNINVHTVAILGSLKFLQVMFIVITRSLIIWKFMD